MKVKMKYGVIEFLFFLASYSYLCDCRNSPWHHRSLVHDTYHKHPSVRINRSFGDIGEDTGQFDDAANSWRVNIFNPMAIRSNTNVKSIKRAALNKKHEKKHSEPSIQRNITSHSLTKVTTKAPGSHHLTSRSATSTAATTTRHSNKSNARSSTSAPTTKPTKQASADLLISAVKSSTSDNKRLHQDIHKEINNLRLRVAIFKTESDLKKLKELILEVENAQQTTTVGSTTPFTGDTTIGVQTTPKPFPGEYKGYIPVTKAVPSTMSPSSHDVRTGKNQRATRRVKNGDNHKKVHRRHKTTHHHMKRKHLKKKKKIGIHNEAHPTETPNEAENLTEGIAELHNHVVITQRLNRINENVVTGLLGIKQLLKALSIHIKKALHEIGNEAADNTNEERTDIQVNSDKIAQLQQGLESKIDDLRYNITTFITSQQELAKSMTWSLEKTVGMLSKMVDKVTDSDSNLHKAQYIINNVTRPKSTAKPAHADTKKHKNKKNSLLSRN